MKAATAVTAMLVAVLAGSLPPHAFFTGDSGVKLIAARNAAAHPDRPFEIDLPRVAARPLPFVDRLFQLHGDHAHVLQSPVFPVLSAPLIALAGLRGAYLLPAISFVLMLPLLDLLRRRAFPGMPAWTLAVGAVLASPLFFYAFEFWEHAPAAALLAAATVLAWPRPDPPSRAGAVGSGLLLGAAVLLRPEAIWYGAALVIVTLARHPARAALAAAGFAALLAPAALANYAHAGDLLGGHLRSNLAALDDAWLAAHVARAAIWFAPSGLAATAGTVLIGAAWIAVAFGRDLRGAQVAGLAGAVLIAAAAMSGQLPRASLWQAWPAGALALIPYRTGLAARQMRMIALLTAAAVFLTSTHDGGAQWGPRFLLVAAPAFLMLSAAAAAELAGRDGRWATLRLALVLVVFAGGAGASRAAYRELRAAKQDYAVLVDATRQAVPEGGILVTDVWWFDQITAALHGRHTVLVASQSAPVTRIVEELARAGAGDFVLVQSREEHSGVSAGAESLVCYAPVASHEVVLRGVVFTTYAAANCHFSGNR